MNIEQYKENSINEGVTSADIAQTDEIVSAIIEQKQLDSLAYQICDVQTIHGPTGSQFSVQYTTNPEIVAVAQIDTIDTITAENSTNYSIIINGESISYTSDGTQQQDTVDTITVANSTVYTLTINGTVATYTSDASATLAEITLGLTNAVNALSEPVTATDLSTSFTILADVGGVAFTTVITAGTMTVTTTIANNDATLAEITLGLTSQINLSAQPVTATDLSTSVTILADVAGTAFDTYVVNGIMTISTTTPNQVFIAESKSVKVLKNSIQVEDDAVQDTGFTLEAIQDMQNQFGKNAIEFIGKIFSGVSSQAENVKLITKIGAVAVGSDTLNLSTAASAESNVFEITQKVAEELLTMNEKNYRTLDAFVILPKKGAAAFLALGSYFSDSENESGLFIGKKGRIKYYINPIVGASDVYIGLNGNIPGNSSLIFSPYHHQLLTAVDPDSGETKVFNVNRYAITENSLSVTDNEMVRKFTLA